MVASCSDSRKPRSTGAGFVLVISLLVVGVVAGFIWASDRKSTAVATPARITTALNALSSKLPAAANSARIVFEAPHGANVADPISTGAVKPCSRRRRPLPASRGRDRSRPRAKAISATAYSARASSVRRRPTRSRPTVRCRHSATTASADPRGLTVDVGGSACNSFPRKSGSSVRRSVSSSRSIILFITFGSLLAAGMPLISRALRDRRRLARPISACPM